MSPASGMIASEANTNTVTAPQWRHSAIAASGMKMSSASSSRSGAGSGSTRRGRSDVAAAVMGRDCASRARGAQAPPERDAISPARAAQGELERRDRPARTHAAGEGHGAPVRFGDLPAQGEADPGAARLGGEERDEQVAGVRDPGAVVLDPHREPVGIGTGA